MTTTSRSAIAVEHLRKVFPSQHGHKEQVAVADLSFDVEAGSALGIVGGSGAGKTTVAALLMGFQQATSGSIRIAGIERPRTLRRNGRTRWAREIQVVFQDPYSSLDPQQPVGRTLDEIVRRHFDLDRGSREKRVSALLDSVGLSASLASALPRALSGGQRQRIAIARVLAVEPRILLLDEPVAALDVSIQAQILNLLNDLREELGLTYLVISHDLGVIRYTTDHVIVLRRGELVEEGQTQHVLDAPSHEYTRLLRDSVPKPHWRQQGVPINVDSAPEQWQ